MLKKLIKYDFRAVIKYWWIAALSSVVLSIAGGWCISVFASEKELPEVLYLVATLVAIVAVLGLCAFSVLTIVFVYSRFYKNFFTDEGYLTFTLPVKRSQLLNSKLIASMMASGLTSLVIILDVAIAIFIGLNKYIEKDFFKEIWDELVGEVIRETGFYAVIYLVEILLLVILFTLFSTLFVFCCITIASIIAKKAKIITAIGVYYVANSVFTFVLQMFWLFCFDSIGNWLYDIPKNLTCPVYALIMLTGILFFGMCCGILYSLQYWMLDRKLNLS